MVSTEPGLTWRVRLVGQQTVGSAHVYLPFPQCWSCIRVCPHLAFYVGAGDGNSDSQACLANTLLAEPFIPSPSDLFFDCCAYQQEMHVLLGIHTLVFFPLMWALRWRIPPSSACLPSLFLQAQPWVLCSGWLTEMFGLVSSSKSLVVAFSLVCYWVICLFTLICSERTVT